MRAADATISYNHSLSHKVIANSSRIHIAFDAQTLSITELNWTIYIELEAFMQFKFHKFHK